MTAVLPLYRSLAGRPFGKAVFSRLFSFKAPYFGTVRPRFVELRPNYAELRIRKRRRVQNHIGTVHVIAIANGLEAAMGALAEASIPPGRRWIPKGMNLEYTALASSDITCVAETDPESWSGSACDRVAVRVSAKRTDGTEVVSGVITLHVSDRPSGTKGAAAPAPPAEPSR